MNPTVWKQGSYKMKQLILLDLLTGLLDRWPMSWMSPKELSSPQLLECMELAAEEQVCGDLSISSFPKTGHVIVAKSLNYTQPPFPLL